MHLYLPQPFLGANSMDDHGVADARDQGQRVETHAHGHLNRQADAGGLIGCVFSPSGHVSCVSPREEKLQQKVHFPRRP